MKMRDLFLPQTLKSSKVGWAVLLVIVFGLFIGLNIPFINVIPWIGTEIASLLFVLVIVALPFLFGMYRNKFDPFEPVYLIAFATFASFVLAPMLLFAGGEIVDSGVNYRPQAIRSILMSGFALLSFVLGYYRAGHQWQQHPPRFANTLNNLNVSDVRVSNWAIVGLLMTGSLFGLWLALNNVSLALLNALAEDNYYRAAITQAQNNIVYLYMMRVTWPALLLLAFPVTFRSSPRRIWIILFWIIAFLLFIISGNRGITFRLLVATGVFFFLMRQTRPSLRLITLFLLLFAVLAGSLVTLRSKQFDGLRVTDLNTSLIMDSVERDLTSGGAATGMMIIQRVFPEKTGFLYFQIFEEVLYALIPRIVWENKPAIRGVLNVAEQYVPKAHAPPIWAPYYAGFGLVGVAASMIVLGIASAWVYSVWLHTPKNVVSAVFLAVWLALLWEMYHRGGIAWSFVNLSYAIGPIMLVVFLAGGIRMNRSVRSPLKKQVTTNV
jgi:oligosaccharide repeat unit polymerase